MRWDGLVALLGRGEMFTGFWWGNLRERDILGRTGWRSGYQRILLKMDLCSK